MMKLDKKILLIETAEKMFAVNGYSETTIREVTKEASMNSAMISYYFGSKAQLVQAIIAYRATDFGYLAENTFFSNQTPLNQLYSLMDDYMEKVFAHKYFYMLLIQIQSIGKEAVLADYFFYFKERNSSLVQDIIQRGCQTGEFKNEIDVSLLMSIIIGTINNILLNRSYFLNQYSIEGLSEEESIRSIKSRIAKNLRQVIYALVVELATFKP